MSKQCRSTDLQVKYLICRDFWYKYSDGSQQTDSELWVPGAGFFWPFSLSIFPLCPVTDSSSSNTFQVLFQWLLAFPAYLNLFYYSQSHEVLILHRFHCYPSPTLHTAIHTLHMPVPGTPISESGRKRYLVGFEQGQVSFKYQQRIMCLDARGESLQI